MVALGSRARRVRAYHTRRPVPAILLAVILSTVAGLVWFTVLHQTEGSCLSRSADSHGATAATAPSYRVPAHGLDTVRPAPPQFTRVEVLNAGGVRGKATVVVGALAHLGFAPTSTPTNDPQHPDFNLHCYGEIRFGAEGQAEARTLSLALPCADLVRDVRTGARVDLALGTKFIALQPNDAARTALLELAGLGQPVPAAPSHSGLSTQMGTQVATQSMAGMTQPVPLVNPDLLRRARQVTC